MTSETRPKVCLDVAIDHRIRRLFKPVVHHQTERSNHVSRIEERGRFLGRCSDEIKTTAKLAGPAVKGGIAITLQQPRHNHPFEKGIDAVIGDCESLYALYDIFRAVSCETLDIRTDITIVDLLPYVFENVAKIGDDELEESFRVSTQIICDKEPGVLLCAGKIWLPRADKSNNRKGDACKFESLRVGERFGSTPKLPVTVRVRPPEERGFVSIRRVNGFHPSHAMNYHSHASLLRQLQILIGAETCGVLRGDWKDEQWMTEIRRRCMEISRGLSASPATSPPPQSPGQSSTRRSRTKYLPEYQELYSDALLDLQNRAKRVILSQRLATSPGTRYDTLLSCGLSEICNDVSLLLRQMLRLECRDWPDSVAWKNENALRDAATDTDRFAADLSKAAKQEGETQLLKIIQHGVESIRECVTGTGGNRPVYTLSLSKACDAFLGLAVDIEILLWNLLLDKEDALRAMGQEEVLSSLMSKVTLTSTAVNMLPHT
ncbi:uncharacterized protein B0J16DRAFT_396219 [Fusarium flagelliforme]|uniref:Uncharacterized protein n=1 Tax=Fusarium flagelliforme TaxID=2675880 RepID=A0A395MEK0_9HYPO|nr:uncharacterized protein B0J16DRAFT_396219 [Fusarium flagelliforme]KAH7188064.1 hypothetical protein B0J16DRAFT_396219 [Fusarium flagelliforme]RFN46276.1 hypothetical protein FIE12Z_9473 [Fusarium flagelliforme]